MASPLVVYSRMIKLSGRMWLTVSIIKGKPSPSPLVMELQVR